MSVISDPKTYAAAHSRTNPKQQLSIEYVSTSALKLSPDNPRVHSKKQMRQIANSIQAFGFNVPVLVDSQLRVIAGHGRVQAAILLAIPELPTIRLEHLTAAQTQAFMIADNKLTENSEWDAHLLAQQFKTLSAVELDFSIDATGFEIDEIDVLVEGLAPETGGENDPADEVPDQASAAQVSRPGDLWLLGRHRICCGDAREESSYVELMEGQQAAMVFTDPPCNVPIARHATGLGKIQHKNVKTASAEMGDGEFTDFLAQVCGLFAAHSAEGSLHFLFMDWRHIGEMVEAGKHAYTELRNVCVWIKGDRGVGSLYRSQHELVFIYKTGGVRHRDNVEPGQYGQYRTNVWNYPGVNSFSRATKKERLLELHATVKPVALVADALRECSAPGDIVLDPFLGSGTTVIAAERTGRICYGIELDPLCVDTTIRRWQAFTGLRGLHGLSGRSFSEVEDEVANELKR